MKIFKLIISVVIVVLLLIFVVLNAGQSVKLFLFSKNNPLEGDMIIFLLISLMIGLLLGIIFTGFQILSERSKLKVVTEEYKRAKRELDMLRNREIEESEERELPKSEKGEGK